MVYDGKKYGEPGWSPEVAADNLSQHVGPRMRDETRAKLEDLASGYFGRESAAKARQALEEQKKYD